MQLSFLGRYIKTTTVHGLQVSYSSFILVGILWGGYKLDLPNRHFLSTLSLFVTRTKSIPFPALTAFDGTSTRALPAAVEHRTITSLACVSNQK